MAQSDLERSVQGIADASARKKAFYTAQREQAESNAPFSAQSADTASKVYGKLGKANQAMEFAKDSGRIQRYGAAGKAYNSVLGAGRGVAERRKKVTDTLDTVSDIAGTIGGLGVAGRVGRGALKMGERFAESDLGRSAVNRAAQAFGRMMRNSSSSRAASKIIEKRPRAIVPNGESVDLSKARNVTPKRLPTSKSGPTQAAKGSERKALTRTRETGGKPIRQQTSKSGPTIAAKGTERKALTGGKSAPKSAKSKPKVKPKSKSKMGDSSFSGY